MFFTSKVFMKKQLSISIRTIGLAIFTMLFGSGNIIFPIKAGVLSGDQNYIGILGFLLTGVLLPIIGLVAMILFDGNYNAFFARTGRVPGFLAILFCMFIIGPFLVMPRCITVPYDLLHPFLSNISLPIFSLLFVLLTFGLTYKESKLLNILGKYISPIKIGSLALIVIIGLMGATNMIHQNISASDVFFSQVLHGFQTLDLLGSLFFAYIIVRLIKINDTHHELNTKQLAVMCLKGGCIASLFMASFYLGFSFLGAYYAHLVHPAMNGAEIFRTITLHVLGQQFGIMILVVAVILSCVATISALAAVFAEYLRNEVFDKSLSYVQCLIIGLSITTIVSNFGLTNILNWSAPIITFGYPIIVTITLCNLAYKLFNFKWIKLPVFLTTIAMIWMYISSWYITL